jgi:MGT family glycosyltransferase
MARFLFTVWPFPGHVNPAIAVAHALRARGHEAFFYTGGSARAVVENEGFPCFPFVKLDEERIDALLHRSYSHFASVWQPLLRARQIKASLREWLLDTVPHQLADLEAARAECRPDVLVCETALWGPILVLGETSRLPVAVLSTVAACLLPGPDVPPWGRGLPRPRNWHMRLRYELEKQLVSWLSADFRAAANAIRRDHGLPPLRISVTEFAGQMPLYLVPSSPEFDYQRRDLPPSVHYVGPCLWDKARDEPPPPWLAQLPSDLPVIHVTEATIHVHEPILLRAAARAFAHRPVQVVMTTGKHRDPVELGLEELPPNIRVERFVPHSDLLPKTSVMVTMGGAGTLLAALKAGVPVVVVPTEWDKPENAQRVVEAGAGLRLEPKRCTPDRLRAAVERVLSQPSFRENARRLAAAFARYPGPPRAAELLEGLVAARPRPRSTHSPGASL